MGTYRSVAAGNALADRLVITKNLSMPGSVSRLSGDQACQSPTQGRQLQAT